MAGQSALLEDGTETGTRICSITLGGFQVFDIPTTIPLGQLTFLFGPNSAGKSSVEDALIVVREAIRTPNKQDPTVPFDANVYQRMPYLRQHWRRSDGSAIGLAPNLLLGLRAHLSVNLSTLMHRSKQRADSSVAPPAAGHYVDLSIKYILFREGDRQDPHAHRDFGLTVDGSEIIALEEQKRFGVNLSHPALIDAQPNADFAALAGRYPSIVACSDGWVWLNSPGTKIAADHSVDRKLFLAYLEVHPDYPDPVHSLERGLDDLSSIFDQLLQSILSNISIKLDVVPASRLIPSPEDLSFTFPTNKNMNDLPVALVAHRDSHRYQELVESILEARRFMLIAEELPEIPEMLASDAAFLYRLVNRALTEHLFIERGYRLEADIFVVAQLDHYLLARSTERPLDDVRSFLVQMYLKDSQGRQFSFEEVGSGLGYVLPVLCAAFSTGSTVTVLQQPELHLHPALQSALGDVLVEAASLPKQLIVETHSEHVLLRILKRIRQTCSGKVPISELRLYPDDVCVVYFDPTPDGTTRVTQLRISADGDFLDMWPRGFFAERDQDLFDE